MANIRIDSPVQVFNGQALTFKSPADCSQITGLRVYYPEGNGTASKDFQFADAHGNNVGDIDLFAEDVLVKVILDVDASRAYVQNADTNAYLEGRFARIEASKPSGSYNGTGNSEVLPIEIDVGVVSANNQAVLIRRSDDPAFSIVTLGGYIGKNDDTVVCGIDAKYNPYTGKLIITSANDLFNAEGKLYRWFML